MWTEATWRLQPKTPQQATLSWGEEDTLGWLVRSVDSFIEALSRMMSSFYFLVFIQNGTFYVFFNSQSLQLRGTCGAVASSLYRHVTSIFDVESNKCSSSVSFEQWLEINRGFAEEDLWVRGSSSRHRSSASNIYIWRPQRFVAITSEYKR